jgi:hypothetical protein
MKFLPPCFVLILAGCQTPPLADPTVPPPPALPVMEPDLATTTELRRQRQLVEALMSQNEALQSQLNQRAAYPVVATTPAEPAPSAMPVEIEVESSQWLTPNDEGVIDLRAAAALAAGESINPFVLREPAGPGEEFMLTVQGIVRGEHPCALVNDRVLTVGDRVGLLRLHRIEPDALFFEWNEFILRIPLHGEPVRVRHS